MDPFGRPDPNGAEALPGESTRDYIARQEKLKTDEEWKGGKKIRDLGRNLLRCRPKNSRLPAAGFRNLY